MIFSSIYFAKVGNDKVYDITESGIMSVCSSLYFLGDSIIKVTPSDVMVGDQVEITCTFNITSNGPRAIILRNKDRQLMKKYRRDFRIIPHLNGSKCASISYFIQNAILADAGVYKCQASGIHGLLQYGVAAYYLPVFSKFLLRSIYWEHMS